MNILIESLKDEWFNLVRLAPKILVALLMFLLILMVGRLISKTISLILSRHNFKPMHTNFFRGLTVWIFAALGLIMALNILGLKALAASLVAGGGITAVVLGFAFREIGENFLAGFFLAFSRPFEVGNFIQSGEFQGVVKSIELRSTHIRTADGRDIFIPSSQIFNNPLVNFTKDGLRRLSFTVGIDYGDDVGRALQLLLKTAGSIMGILDNPAPMTNISNLDANFVVLEVHYWIDTFQEKIDFVKTRNDLINKSRTVLLENGFTLSCNVTTNVALGGYQPVDIRLNQGVS
jgi:small-conductance mechanosensitive channel